QYFPPIDETLHALYISGSARLDGRLLGEALVSGFKKNGGKVIDEKVRLTKKDGSVQVQTSDGNISADQLIVAAGAWSKELLQDVDIPLNISPQRGQIAHVTVEEDTSKWPVILPQDSSHYIVAFDDNRIAFGATREEGSGFDYRLTAGGVQEVLREGLKVVPGLKNSTLKETRIGFRPMGPDIKPLLGKVLDADNLIVATGLGASGLTMGPYVGSLAAKVALNEEAGIDLSPYDPLRSTTLGRKDDQRHSIEMASHSRGSKGREMSCCNRMLSAVIAGGISPLPSCSCGGMSNSLGGSGHSWWGVVHYACFLALLHTNEFFRWT